MIENITETIRTNGRKYSKRSNRDRTFYPREWVKFYEALLEKQKPTFQVLLNTGARIKEARNIKVGDIDLINKRLTLRVTKVKAAKGEINSRPRIIPISTQFAKWLKHYINEKGLKNEDNLKLLSTPAANICLKKTLVKAGINDYYMFSIHNIRKTFENWLMAVNVHPMKITSHLGHSGQVASSNYLSPDLYSYDEKMLIRTILGDLYQEGRI